MIIFGGIVLMLTCTYWFTHSFKISVGSGPKVRTMRVVSLDGPEHAVPDINEEEQVQSLRDYMATHIADPDVELLTMTEPVIFQARTWRVARLRGKNAFGGPVINEYFVAFRGDKVSKMAPVTDFSEIPGTSKEENQAFLRGIASANEIDLHRK